MIPQPPAKSVRPSRAPAKIRASADGGWMSEKYPLLAEEEECFFLTSPFIEPDGQRRRMAAPLGAADSRLLLPDQLGMEIRDPTPNRL
jgi:hypothetical protein